MPTNEHRDRIVVHSTRKELVHHIDQMVEEWEQNPVTIDDTIVKRLLKQSTEQDANLIFTTLRKELLRHTYFPIVYTDTTETWICRGNEGIPLEKLQHIYEDIRTNQFEPTNTQNLFAKYILGFGALPSFEIISQESFAARVVQYIVSHTEEMHGFPMKSHLITIPEGHGLADRFKENIHKTGIDLVCVNDFMDLVRDAGFTRRNTNTNGVLVYSSTPQPLTHHRPIVPPTKPRGE